MYGVEFKLRFEGIFFLHLYVFYSEDGIVRFLREVRTFAPEHGRSVPEDSNLRGRPMLVIQIKRNQMQTEHK